MFDKKARRVKHWPEGELLRERFTVHGPAALAKDSFSPIIKSCKAGCTALDLAAEILERFFYCFQLDVKD
ncbi:MAG TPA: hypothetical protein VMM54_11820 [Nitrospirota bacterium]|nr:hypothetical protein [Nitrospirota bacterium]